MKKLLNSFVSPGISCGWMYFYVHFVTEILCFFLMTRVTGSNDYLWALYLFFDFVAFVPQSLIGKINDKHPKFNMGLLGMGLMILAGLSMSYGPIPTFLNVTVLCIGNACTHVSGAEVTLRASDGKLSHPALFVAGGSFGLILGKTLAATELKPCFVMLFALTSFPFLIMGEKFKKAETPASETCGNFNYTNKNLKIKTVIFLSTLIVIVRGYMGYGIPTTWKRTVIQGIIFYFAMGIGKAMGGFLSDAFGPKKIGIISIVAALPFLIIGDNNMAISLFGVMLFSMTMSVTLALLVSVIKDKPGYAFGFTTIGLFLGSAPVFFFSPGKGIGNIIMLISLSALCLAFMLILFKGVEHNDSFERSFEHDSLAAADNNN